MAASNPCWADWLAVCAPCWGQASAVPVYQEGTCAAASTNDYTMDESERR